MSVSSERASHRSVSVAVYTDGLATCNSRPPIARLFVAWTVEINPTNTYWKIAEYRKSSDYKFDACNPDHTPPHDTADKAKGTTLNFDLTLTRHLSL